jgi:hypothetical protein
MWYLTPNRGTLNANKRALKKRKNVIGTRVPDDGAVNSLGTEQTSEWKNAETSEDIDIDR